MDFPSLPGPSSARAIGIVRSGIALRFPWIALLVLAFRAFAVQITREPVVEATPTNALVRWSTDVRCGSRVRYGTDREHLDQHADDAVAENHRATLRGLKPGTEYWYAVGTLRIALATNRFSTPAAAVIPGPNPDGTVPAAPRAPPATATWGNPRSLQDHFDRHGADFGTRDPDDYAAKAWWFLREARAGKLRAKIDESGDLRVYDPATRSFAAYNKNGTTKTYFKPGRRDYFDDQPGKPATLRQLQEFPLPR